MSSKAAAHEYCVYRYVLVPTGEVIYVGKTDASLKQRIDAHEREDKFQPFRGFWKVEFVRLTNKVETDVAERFLINQLKPVLNEKDKITGLSERIDISLPEWIPYEDRTGEKTQLELDLDFYYMALDAVYGDSYSLLSSTLHPTGRLPIDISSLRELQITEKGVYEIISKEETKGFLKECQTCYFKQQLTKEGRELLNEKPSQILLAIYLKNGKKLPGIYRLLWKFGDLLKEYKRNGFYDDELSERNILKLPEEFLGLSVRKELFQWYKSFIKQIPGTDYVEVDSDRFDELPDLFEKIAEAACIEFKQKEVLYE